MESFSERTEAKKENLQDRIKEAARQRAQNTAEANPQKTVPPQTTPKLTDLMSPDVLDKLKQAEKTMKGSNAAIANPADIQKMPRDTEFLKNPQKFLDEQREQIRKGQMPSPLDRPATTAEPPKPKERQLPPSQQEKSGAPPKIENPENRAGERPGLRREGIESSSAVSSAGQELRGSIITIRTLPDGTPRNTYFAPEVEKMIHAPVTNMNNPAAKPSTVYSNGVMRTVIGMTQSNDISFDGDTLKKSPVAQHLEGKNLRELDLQELKTVINDQKTSGIPFTDFDRGAIKSLQNEYAVKMLPTPGFSAQSMPQYKQEMQDYQSAQNTLKEIAATVSGAPPAAPAPQSNLPPASRLPVSYSEPTRSGLKCDGVETCRAHFTSAAMGIEQERKPAAPTIQPAAQKYDTLQI